MEDANSLLLDILSGLDDELVQSLFGVGVLSVVVCQQCEPHLRAGLSLLADLFPSWGNPLLKLVAGYWIGAQSEQMVSENTLALAIPEEKSINPSPLRSKQSNAALALSNKLSLDGMLNNLGSSVSLEECLTQYCAQEKVSDFKCENCSQKGHSVKRLFLQTFPPVLVIQLKRFKPVQRVMTKCHTRVHVPSVLDLGFLSSLGESTRYALSSMVVHDGGMGGGHYMAYVRGVKQGPGVLTEDDASMDEFQRERWVWFSDRFFGSIPKQELDVQAEPYLLFYRRET